jgi:hypothetical protein
MFEMEIACYNQHVPYLACKLPKIKVRVTSGLHASYLSGNVPLRALNSSFPDTLLGGTSSRGLSSRSSLPPLRLAASSERSFEYVGSLYTDSLRLGSSSISL